MNEEKLQSAITRLKEDLKNPKYGSADVFMGEVLETLDFPKIAEYVFKADGKCRVACAKEILCMIEESMVDYYDTRSADNVVTLYSHPGGRSE